MGFDLGSSGGKGVIVDSEGNILSFCSSSHETIRQNPGWAEQDAEISWWQGFKKISRRLLENSGIESSQIEAVGITGLVPGLCPLDVRGKVVRNAILHTDLRAYKELDSVSRILPEPITLGCLIPKLIWFKDHEPENYKKTDKIVNPHSFIIYRLTGSITCDYDTATKTGGMLDREKLKWDRAVCEELGVRRDILPELLSAASIAGGITGKAAEETGLLQGTPVIAGTGDSFSALLGHGVISGGDLMIYLGSSGTQILVSRNLQELVNMPHFGPGKAEFAGRIVSSGDSMEHFRMMLGNKNWETLNNGAEGVKPGSDRLIVVPHLKEKSEAKSSVFDRETVFGLVETHTSLHVYRALLEGIAYNLKDGFLTVRDKVRRVVLSGGGARSKVFGQIISDILDFPVEVSLKGSGSLGIAFLAGYGTGLITDFKGTSAKWFSDYSIIRPVPRNVAVYSKYYTFYKELKKKLGALYEPLDLLP